MKNHIMILLLLLTSSTYGQGFIAEVEEEGLSSLFGNQCITYMALTARAADYPVAP